jgi:acylphosphatase
LTKYFDGLEFKKLAISNKIGEVIVMGSINKAKVRIHIFVSGKVQGVNFRAEIKKKADKYSVSGFAKNLLDGQVEIVLEGERVKVLEVIGWLGKGPQISKISRYEQKWEMFINEFKGKEFKIR